MQDLIAIAKPTADEEISAKQAATGVAGRLPLWEFDIVGSEGAQSRGSWTRRSKPVVGRRLAIASHLYAAALEGWYVARATDGIFGGRLRSDQRPRLMQKHNCTRHLPNFSIQIAVNQRFSLESGIVLFATRAAEGSSAVLQPPPRALMSCTLATICSMR